MGGERKQPRIAKALSEFVLNASFEDLPADVIHQTKRLILDTLGCTIGGYYSEGSRIIRRMARAWGGEPQAFIIGGGWKTSSVHAAWVNGYMGMALDGDDTFIAHPAVPVIHGILPLAEYVGASGKEMITAVAVGYDVLASFGLSVEPEFRPTKEGFSLKPVSGMGWKILGAVAGASKILRLSEEEMIHAFCLAVQFSRAPSAAKWSYPIESMPLSKYYDAGGTAQSGMLAALLAREGMTAPTGLLEGKYGFFKMQGFEECNVDFMLESLGKKWWILETSFKPWPSCRLTHHALTAFEKIVGREGIKGEEIDKVVVKGGLTYNPIFHVKHPETPVNRQFSLNHCLANIAFRVPRGLLWHDARKAAEPEMKEFREKVTFEPDPKTLKAVAEDFGGEPPHLLKRVPTTVEVSVQDKTFTEYTEYAHGDPWTSESVMSDDELMSKFRDFAKTLSTSVPWREKAERARGLLLGLEEVMEVSEVTELLSP